MVVAIHRDVAAGPGGGVARVGGAAIVVVAGSRRPLTRDRPRWRGDADVASRAGIAVVAARAGRGRHAEALSLAVAGVAGGAAVAVGAHGPQGRIGPDTHARDVAGVLPRAGIAVAASGPGRRGVHALPGRRIAGIGGAGIIVVAGDARAEILWRHGVAGAQGAFLFFAVGLRRRPDVSTGVGRTVQPGDDSFTDGETGAGERVIGQYGGRPGERCEESEDESTTRIAPHEENLLRRPESLAVLETWRPPHAEAAHQFSVNTTTAIAERLSTPG